MIVRASPLGLLAVAACGHGSAVATSTAGAAPGDAARAGSSVPVHDDTRDAGEGAPASPELAWSIGEGRVGPVELGRALPGVLLEVPELEAHYVARYIADAQPLDGFRYAEPPLTIVLAIGPFAELVASGEGRGEPRVDRLRAKAAAAARGGATVKAVMIHGAGPSTEAGLGVGSSLADLEASYRDLRLVPMPPTLGDDRCVAHSSAAKGISFVFGDCKQARAGEPVKRVDLWIPGS